MTEVNMDTALKRALHDRGTELTKEDLVENIVRDWLVQHGYLEPPAGEEYYYEDEDEELGKSVL